MLAISGNVVAYALGVVVSLAAATFAFRQRRSPGGMWLFLMLLATAAWSLAEAFDFSVTTLPAHILCAKLSYLGATTAPVFYALFAIEYCGLVRRVSPYLAVAALGIPAGVTFAGFLNEYHHLVWAGFQLDPANPAIIVYSHGPLYWLVTLYGLALGLGASIPIAGLASRVRGLYRMQSVATMLAVVFPWVAELAYSFDPARLPGFDPAITLGISGGVLVVTMTRYRLLDLVPVARETIIEDMGDGVVVLDAERRIVEINPAAVRLLGLEERPAPGTPASAIMASWPAAILGEIAAVARGEAKQFVADSGRWLSVQHMELSTNMDRPRDVYMLRDITRQVKAENQLQDAYATLAQRLDQIVALQAELHDRATRDMLTGLYNRRYFAEALAREIARADREGYPVSLVMLDVDHFKEVNDSCGHSGGDAVLRVLGAELRATSRQGDVSCRYGGDEFMVLLPNTTTESAIRFAERWRMALRYAMSREVGDGCSPSVSLGVATYPADGADEEAIVIAADSAVYAAKAGGRDRVAIAPHRTASPELPPERDRC